MEGIDRIRLWELQSDFNTGMFLLRFLVIKKRESVLICGLWAALFTK